SIPARKALLPGQPRRIAINQTTPGLKALRQGLQPRIATSRTILALKVPLPAPPPPIAINQITPGLKALRLALPLRTATKLALDRSLLQPATTPPLPFAATSTATALMARVGIPTIPVRGLLPAGMPTTLGRLPTGVRRLPGAPSI